MGGDEPELAKPSPEETALISEQTNLLRTSGGILGQQNELLNLLEPELLSKIGFDVQQDDNGKIIGLGLKEDALAGGRADIEQGLIDRSKAALSGDLPLDPVLLRTLEKQQEDLESNLRSRLGTGFDTSSAGIEALSEQNLIAAIAKSDSARKDLVTSEGLRTNAQQSNESLIDSLISRTLGVAGARTAPAVGLAGVASGFQGPISGFQADRHAQFQSDVQNADSGFLGGFGEFLGTAAFAPVSGLQGGSLFGKGVSLFT